MVGKDDLLDDVSNLPEFELKKIYFRNNGDLVKTERFLAVVNEKEVFACVSKRYILVQFRDLFRNLLSKFDNYIGEVIYWRGRASLIVFPEGSDVGLYVLNSVDKSTSVFIRFLVESKYGYLVVPKMKMFRQVHMGDKVEFKIEDHVELLKKVESEWKEIVEKFSKTTVTQENLAAILDGITTNKEFHEYISELHKNGNIANFWDLFLELTKNIDILRCRSKLQRFKIVERISDLLYNVSMSMKL
jgi:hypothetical protein